MKTKQLFSFGMIADVQHANAENCINYQRTHMRRYRDAIGHLKEAVITWNENSVDFVIQLGDLIDGKSKQVGKTNEDFNNLVNILNEYNAAGLPVSKENQHFKMEEDESSYSPYICNIWGNHEFYNFSRESLWNSSINSFIKPITESKYDALVENRDYYFYFCFHGMRIIALDTYDISVLSRKEGSKEYEKAVSLLNTYNKNKDKQQPHSNAPRYVNWNGGVGDRQLSWLHEQLVQATELKERVILLSHIPFHPQASDEKTICWNNDVVLSMIGCFNCVVACFAGHQHDGGYFHDKNTGIFYLSLPGVVERECNRNAYAVVNVFEDYMQFVGHGGDLNSYKIDFPPRETNKM